MSYTVEQVAAEGYRRYIEVEGGEWWDEEHALHRAHTMWEYFQEEGMDFEAAADELAGTLYMEQ